MGSVAGYVWWIGVSHLLDLLDLLTNDLGMMMDHSGDLLDLLNMLDLLNRWGQSHPVGCNLLTPGYIPSSHSTTSNTSSQPNSGTGTSTSEITEN